MRPTLNVLSATLIDDILDEAKRIMAETGMEIRGANMRQRLLDHGLKTDASGKRGVLCVVARARLGHRGERRDARFDCIHEAEGPIRPEYQSRASCYRLVTRPARPRPHRSQFSTRPREP